MYPNKILGPLAMVAISVCGEQDIIHIIEQEVCIKRASSWKMNKDDYVKEYQ